MEKLNTMDTFSNGFNIVRNGEIITLTPKEMSDFRYLEQAVIGRECLYFYREWANENDKKVIDAMINDEDICYNIESDILQSIGDIEADVINDYVKGNR